MLTSRPRPLPTSAASRRDFVALLARAWPVLLVLLALTAGPRTGWAQEPSAELEAARAVFEVSLEPEVDALDATARAAWDRANALRDAEDYPGAAAAFAEVNAAAPDFHHAHRRRCTSLLFADEPGPALAACEQAVALAATPDNEVALAWALAEAPGGDWTRARVYVRNALDEDPDVLLVGEACSVAGRLGDIALLGTCSRKLKELAPGAWETHFIEATYMASQGQADAAFGALDRARELGLDEASYRQMHASFERGLHPGRFWGVRAGVVALAWAALAGLLLLAAATLSRLTLAEAERALTNPQASAQASDSRLRKAYAVVLWLCCAYYYASVPLVLLSVVALAGGLLFLFLAIGRIPIKFLLIVAIVGFVTIASVVKSLFVRGSDEDPGELLEPGDAPGLVEALAEVAAKVGTRPVDKVYLTVGTELAVFERGGLWAKLRGKGERCLILGVGVLEGLDVRALKAILAHEYGHFSNEDTAGGNLALGVRRSVITSIVAMAEGGAAAWYNPAWLFMLGFHKVFLRVSQGASRLQEVLADRWSAQTYGGASFERGLRHVIEAELRFSAMANAAVHQVLQSEAPVLPNIYRFELAEPPGEDVDSWELFEQRIARGIDEAVHEEPSPYDSHPRPADRFRWAKALSVDEGERGDEGPAWALFADRGGIEERMTAEIRRNVQAQTGLRLLAQPEARGERTAPA